VELSKFVNGCRGIAISLKVPRQLVTLSCRCTGSRPERPRATNAMVAIRKSKMSRKSLRIQQASAQASLMGGLVGLVGLVAILTLTGCGGGGNTTGSSTRTLSSISVSPGSFTILAGGGEQFTANASYSDGSKANVTSSASWASSDSTKASISNAGMASGLAEGTVTITATLSGVSGTATLTVAGLSAVSVGPLDPTITAGETQQLFATATYSNTALADVTSSAVWTSSDTTLATVQSKGDAHPGLVTAGSAPGKVTITAAYGGLSGSSTLTLTSSSGNASPIPLMDMTPLDNYLSFPGGLYENSSDTLPADHDLAGVATTAQIQPLDTNGNPSPTGKVVFLSVGRSTANDEFTLFVTQAQTNAGVNHSTLVIANGTLDAALPCVWTVASGPPPCDPGLGNQYDRIRDNVLAPLGLSEKQVQAIWVEDYDADPESAGYQALCDPTVSGCSNTVSQTEALRYEQEIAAALRAAKSRWPHLQQAFQSSRIYAGYSTTGHSTEPYAYEYGFSVKWLIEAQIVQARSGTVDPTAGDLNYANGTAPWTAWGPYLWANGPTPRSDGLAWCNGQAGQPCNGEVDYQTDGTHPNGTGDTKVSNLLMNFFLGSPYTPWFRP
jgi:Bacterial Ig-like domain (group 2)